MTDYSRWKKADLISRLLGIEAERSVEMRVMLALEQMPPPPDPMTSARAELALSLARRIDARVTPANAVPGLTKELVALLDGLGKGRSLGDDFDDELRGLSPS